MFLSYVSVLCPFQSVIPPAGSAPGHLQTTVRPVPPRPACTRVSVSPPAHEASLSRTISAKVRAHTAPDSETVKPQTYKQPHEEVKS